MDARRGSEAPDATPGSEMRERRDPAAPPRVRAPIRTVFFDAGGTLIDIQYSHLREVMAEVRGHAEARSTIEAAPSCGGKAPSGGAGARGAVDPASGVGLPDDARFEAAERSARAWYLDWVRRGGVPGDAWRVYMDRLYEGVGVGAAEREALLDRLWERNITRGLWHRAAPDAAGTLNRLRGAGLRLAVISNSEGRVAGDLAEAGLARFFETIIDSHRVGVSKPDPRIFRIALDRMGARPEESLYVGDIYEIDVRGARAAGMDAVLVDGWGLQPDAPCPRIASVERLPELLALGTGY